MMIGNRRFRPLVYIPMIVGGIVLALAMAFLLGLVVMWLWNWLMPVIFGLPTINYWQGWGLVLLAHILFKAGVHHHDHEKRHDHAWEWRKKMRDRISEKLSPENKTPGSDSTGKQEKEQQEPGL
ncbi:MAG TPA: hypothetical protein VMX75_02740 [Spirochaetia bacterium]|nr:hypothetical protein [Spirochaetia bacterium]